MRLLPAGPAPSAPVSTAPSRGAETVLVIEDDDAVRLLLGRTLRKLGYEVHLAATGLEALVQYEMYGDRIDVLLSDVVMPGISGPETVRRILAAGGRQPGVIFMSGHTDHALLRDGRLQCARNFMQKPLARATIARMLRDTLDERADVLSA